MAKELRDRQIKAVGFRDGRTAVGKQPCTLPTLSSQPLANSSNITATAPACIALRRPELRPPWAACCVPERWRPSGAARPVESTGCCHRCRESADRLLRVAIGVQQRHHLDAHQPGFMDGVVFLPRIDDHHRFRQPVHQPQAVQVAVHLATFAGQGRLPLLGIRLDFARFENPVEFFQPLQPAANGAEIREQPPQPAIIDVRHAHCQGRSRMASAACFFVPTNSTRLPCEATFCR